MMTIAKKYINEIPVLILEEADKKDQPLPTVVYYHGFNGEKESNLTLAYKMVAKGLRVVLPESIYHGERRHDATAQDIDMAFWQIVIQNIKELGEIKAYLEEEELLLDGQIAIGGTSMGGITTYGALRTYDWIKTGAVLMGTPYMTSYAKMIIDRFENNHGKTLPEVMINDTLEMLAAFDITNDLQTLNNRPLFIWHGAKDAIVPVDHSRQFIDEVKPLYENTESLYYLEEADRIHNISKRSMDETAAWFEKYLTK